MPKKAKPVLEDVLFSIQSDLASLKKNMVTKEDAKNFATKDDLKDLAKQKDLLEVKDKLDELYSFSEKAFNNLFDWVEEVHHSIVEEELPKRVKKLEKILQQ